MSGAAPPPEERRLNCLAFLRITVLGPSSCGKTSLINSYVNAICPYRYVPTDKAVVYHKRLEISDEAEYHETRKPFAIEVEDTPGSERGNDDDVADEDKDRGGPPRIRKGARVVVSSDRSAVMSMFKAFQAKGGNVRYRSAMDGMLGKEFGVKQVALDGGYGLPSPDGSEGGVWSFPPDALRLKVALEMPVDKFLAVGERPGPPLKDLAERRRHYKALQFPFRAYDRPIGDADMDKTLTRNRMGYFLCFDISDESGDSLKEVMWLYLMLTQALEKRPNQKFRPYIWVVACKCDKNAVHATVLGNREKARLWADHEERPYFETSAKNHSGVDTLFTAMIQAINSRTRLWSLEGDDENLEEVEDPANCSLQ